MARTTLNIDTPILRDLKRMQRREKIPLGRLVSDLVAEALAQRGKEPDPPAFVWITEEMKPRRRFWRIVLIGGRFSA